MFSLKIAENVEENALIIKVRSKEIRKG